MTFPEPKRLETPSLRETMAETIRQQTANPYWRLTQRAIRRFEPAGD
ncbi:MAG: hypothetical protein ACKO6H_00660 [Betaproteobacteria bacterium]